MAAACTALDSFSWSLFDTITTIDAAPEQRQVATAFWCASRTKMGVFEVDDHMVAKIARSIDTYAKFATVCGSPPTVPRVSDAVSSMFRMVLCLDTPTIEGLLAFEAVKDVGGLAEAYKTWRSRYQAPCTVDSMQEYMELACACFLGYMAGALAAPARFMGVCLVHEVQKWALMPYASEQNNKLAQHKTIPAAAGRAFAIVDKIATILEANGTPALWTRFCEFLPTLTRLEWDCRRRLLDVKMTFGFQTARLMRFMAEQTKLKALSAPTRPGWQSSSYPEPKGAQTERALFHGKFAQLAWMRHLLAENASTIVIAGGAATAAAARMIAYKRDGNEASLGWESSDMDLFLCGTPGQRSVALAKILAEMATHHPNASVWFDRGVVTIDVTGGKRVSAPEYLQYESSSVLVQIVSTEFDNAVDLVLRFDQTYLQWYYNGTSLVGTIEAHAALHGGANWYTGMQVGSRAFAARAQKAVARGVGMPQKSPFISTLRVFKMQYWDDPDGKLEVVHGRGIPEDVARAIAAERATDRCSGFDMFKRTDKPMTPRRAFVYLSEAFNAIPKDPITSTWTDIPPAFTDGARHFFSGTINASCAVDLVRVARVEHVGLDLCLHLEVSDVVREKVVAMLDAVHAKNPVVMESPRTAECLARLISTPEKLLKVWVRAGNTELEWAAEGEPVPKRVCHDDGTPVTISVEEGSVVSLACHLEGECDAGMLVNVDLVCLSGRDHGKTTGYLNAMMVARRCKEAYVEPRNPDPKKNNVSGVRIRFNQKRSVSEPVSCDAGTPSTAVQDGEPSQPIAATNANQDAGEAGNGEWVMVAAPEPVAVETATATDINTSAADVCAQRARAMIDAEVDEMVCEFNKFMLSNPDMVNHVIDALDQAVKRMRVAQPPRAADEGCSSGSGSCAPHGIE